MKRAQFSDKVVLVTGSTSGIGKNIACAFGTEGATTVITGHNRNKGLLTERELKKSGIDAYYFPKDLNVSGASRQLIIDIVKRFGKIDILVNNARAGKRMSLLEETEDNWNDTFSVSLKAAFFLSQEAIRFMKLKRKGSIVNISSVAGFVAGHDSASYQTAKAAMIHMTRYMALNAGEYGIRVNCIAPGLIIKDEFISRYSNKSNSSYRQIAEYAHPLRRTGRSGDIAQAVLFLCSEMASFITGQCLPVDGGLTIQDQSGLLFRFADNLKRK